MQEEYKYTKAALPSLISSVSEERLSTYMRIANTTNPEVALKLYICNTKLSESFYSPLQGLEVSLRNKIHNTLAKVYGPNWLISGKFKFEYAQSEQIKKATAFNVPIVIPKLIAELNLGFWTGLLGRHYEEEWRSYLRFIFKYSKSALVRKDIHNEMDNIRKLRNRIAHHEPIIERNLESDYKSIIEILSLVCPETSRWVEMHSSFKEAFSNNHLQN